MERVESILKWVSGRVEAGTKGLAVIGLIAVVLAVGYLAGLADPAIIVWLGKYHEEVRNIGLVAAAVVGLPFAIWRVRTAAKQAEIAEASHHAELFTKAVEQLGADKPIWVDESRESTPRQVTVANIEVRLGGIYALERLSKISLPFYGPVFETLASYVRETSRHLNPPQAQTVEPDSEDQIAIERDPEFRDEPARPSGTPRIDIQAALTVIGDRARVRLDRGDSSRRRINLRTARIEGVDLLEANLRSVDLREVDLRGAVLRQADLSHADLTEASLGHADLYMANLQMADLQLADLRCATLLEADLRGADIREADLRYAQLREATLVGATLSGAVLDRAILLGANLKEVNFVIAFMSGVVLEEADLRKADLSMAILQGTRCGLADFRSAQLHYADLTEAEDLTQEQINSALGNAGTKLPEGLTRPDHWDKDGTEDAEEI